MLDYFGYNAQMMLPQKSPNDLRPTQVYAGMTEFQESNNIMGGGDMMLPTLLPGTKLPPPKAPDMSYFTKLNKKMTEDILEKADPWEKGEKDTVDLYIEKMMNSTGARPMGSLDAFHTYLGDAPMVALMNLDDFDLNEIDISGLP